MKKKNKIKKHNNPDEKWYYFGRFRVVSPSNKALYIPSIGWVISMTLGVILVTLVFLHQLVMLPVPMDPLLMPPVSQRFPSFHIESMSPTFSHHFPYSLIRRKLKPESAIPQLSWICMSTIPQLYFLCMLDIPDTVTGSCTSAFFAFFQIIQCCWVPHVGLWGMP